MHTWLSFEKDHIEATVIGLDADDVPSGNGI